MFGYQNPKERPAQEIAGAYRRNRVLFPIILALLFTLGVIIATHCIDIYYNNIPEIVARYPVTFNNFNLLFIISAAFTVFPLLYFVIGFLVFENRRKKMFGLALLYFLILVGSAAGYLVLFGAFSS